jgi:probable rRNA maturation factor
MQPTVILERHVPGLSERHFQAFIADVCRLTKLAGGITVLVTGNRQMRTLNQRFRGKNTATDVLSFPGPTFVKDFAGDIAISFDIAAKNARIRGHSTATELQILALHGVLHLAGYDHESDNGQMTRIEMRIRKELGLPSSLIERSKSQRSRART